MNLPRPSPGYDPNNEAQARDALTRADAENYKHGRDVELSPGQRLILRSPAGVRWRASIDEAGLITAQPLGASGLAITAAEPLAAGALCNIFTSGGVAAIRNANATDATRPANAFVLEGYASAVEAVPRFTGQAITGLSGLTPGTTYYLSTAAGALSSTPPSATGNVVQEIGVALSASVLIFQAKIAIQL
jgi:hypothetical protein